MLYDENCWLSIMCFLAHKDLRDFYITTTDELLGASSSHKYKDKKDVFNLICQGIRSSEFASAKGAYLRHFKNTEDTNWKKLEYGEKNYMIIRMDPGFYVRATGKESYKNNGFSKAENGVYRGFLGASEILQNIIQNTLEYYDISNKFVILKGLECKCNSQDENIYYMEV